MANDRRAPAASGLRLFLSSPLLCFRSAQPESEARTQSTSCPASPRLRADGRTAGEQGRRNGVSGLLSFPVSVRRASTLLCGRRAGRPRCTGGWHLSRSELNWRDGLR
ncbi:hypothetical protein GUJ93_ZPchr0004g40503 [Zizania palustris]|uniref:Uncharacterized protein n=1 Tax=Zizania palustris TaxID=103762 RepID=A0A8J5SKY1_ZIZPA|nr:hypothetical protein GUJ93_ZPchr0004g40503 [Zizania palustris]